MSADEILDVIIHCSCIVGLHPDEATGAIADLALALGKPFVIIPCCVHTKLFPFRKLKNGMPITNHKLLIQWLREKHPLIAQLVIPFKGKNRVLYKL